VTTGKMKPRQLSDTVISWLFVGVGLCVAIVLDKHGATHRWHAGIAWTVIPFASTVMLCRDRWGSGQFWALWLALLCGHVCLMWVIFSYLLPSVSVGMLYVVPLAFVETYLVLACLSPKWRIRIQARR